MKNEWKDATVTDIRLALYVPFNAGNKHHTDRPFHGLVMNDLSGSEKDYFFSDGQILRTKPGEVFYLPKGSTYRVETVGSGGGCWAINFSLLTEIRDAPFTVATKDPTSFRDIFKEAAAAFRLGGDDRDLTIRRDLYTILLKLRKELRRGYVPSSKTQLIAPAMDTIRTGFTDHTLSVHGLAALCGISEAYFRRIFADCYGTGPQEYIIGCRIRYAKQLLQNGQFSVAEVAEMCGFFEPCHFSRAFSKHVGISPRAYAKAQGNTCRND